MREREKKKKEEEEEEEDRILLTFLRIVPSILKFLEFWIIIFVLLHDLAVKRIYKMNSRSEQTQL